MILIPIDGILLVISPRPTTVLEYFELLQFNPFLGLVALDLLYVIDQVLIIPIILSLYVTLKHIIKSVVLVVTVSCIVALSTIFATNMFVDMLNLSNQYVLANAEEQSRLIAAGEPLLASNLGTGYHVHIILGSISVIILSVVMLREDTYGKGTAYSGILANNLTLSTYEPLIQLVLLTTSLIFFIIWDVLLLRSFIKLSRGSN